MDAAQARHGRHGQPRHRHGDTRQHEAEAEVQSGYGEKIDRHHPTGDQPKHRHANQANGQAEKNDRPAAHAVETRLKKPKRPECADELGRRGEHDVVVLHAGLGLEVLDRERGQTTQRDRHEQLHPEQLAKRLVRENLGPRRLLFFAGLLAWRRGVRHAANEVDAPRPREAAEREQDTELPARRRLAKVRSDQQERHQAAGIDEGALEREIAAADVLRDQPANPRIPGATCDAANQVEGEQKHEHQRELALLVDHAIHQRHEHQPEHENQPQRPAGGDEQLVAPAPHVRGDGNLENDHQRRHPGDEANHGGAGPEALCVQKDRAVHDDLARQEIEEEKPEQALDTSGEFGLGSVVAQGR